MSGIVNYSHNVVKILGKFTSFYNNCHSSNSSSDRSSKLFSKKSFPTKAGNTRNTCSKGILLTPSLKRGSFSGPNSTLILKYLSKVIAAPT